MEGQSQKTTMAEVESCGDRALASELVRLVRTVQANVQELVQGWQAFSRDLPSQSRDPQLVLVRRADIEQLATEAMMLKDFLPKVLSPEYLSMPRALTAKEQELSAASMKKQELSVQCEYLTKRIETVMNDCDQEKQEKFGAKCEVRELTQQLAQQADYCSSMGAACCTLLWRVSRHEECIHSILSGSKVLEFLQLVSGTLQSYLATYSEGFPEENSDEAQFVLALCGIVTNIAASAFGREFLSSNSDGLALVDVLCTVLSQAPKEQSVKLKSLVLMSLFNISINQKGLAHLNGKDDLMRVLVWLLREESDTTNRLHTIKLLQSLVMEPDSSTVVHRALEAIPSSLLEQLSSHPHSDVRESAVELMSDLRSLQQNIITQ